MSAVVECHDLTKYHGSSRGIMDLTLAVERGDLRTPRSPLQSSSSHAET